MVGTGFVVVGTPANAPKTVGETTVIRYDSEWSESVKTIAAGPSQGSSMAAWYS